MPSSTVPRLALGITAVAACRMAGALPSLWGPLPPQARAAAVVDMAQSGGYTTKMLEKMVAVRVPPPALKGDFVVQVADTDFLLKADTCARTANLALLMAGLA